jgi:hypothetical protein
MGNCRNTQRQRKNGDGKKQRAAADGTEREAQIGRQAGHDLYTAIRDRGYQQNPTAWCSIRYVRRRR